jgi:hypothetical protein
MSTELETSECEIGNSRPTDRPTKLLSLEAAREQRKLHGYGGWLGI